MTGWKRRPSTSGRRRGGRGGGREVERRDGGENMEWKCNRKSETLFVLIEILILAKSKKRN